MKRFFLLVAVLALVAASCGDSESTTTTTTTESPSTTLSATTTAPATSTPPTTVTPPVTTAPPIAAPALEADYVAIYYPIDGVQVSPVSRPVQAGVDPAAEAVMYLLAGPTPAETAGMPPIYGVAEDAELLGLSVANGVATVDLSNEFNAPTGTSGETTALAALTFTLTDFDDIDEVVLMLEGERIKYFGGHGWDVTPSLNRDTFMVNQGALGDIMICEPAWWSPVSSPITMTGYAIGHQGKVSFAVYDAEGLELVGGETDLISTGFDHGLFEWTFAYEVDSLQLGSLMVWDGSSGAAGQGNLVEHPIWLYPQA